MAGLRDRLKIHEENLKEINDFLLKKDNQLVNDLLEIVDKYGGVDEINHKAEEARKIDKLMDRLRKDESPFVKDLEWLTKQRDKEAFISVSEYRKKVLGKKADSMKFDESIAVTWRLARSTSSHGWLRKRRRRLQNRSSCQRGTSVCVQ